MKKNLYIKNRLEDVEDSLRYCKKKKFNSNEIQEISIKVKKIRDLYSKKDEFLKHKKEFTLKTLFEPYEVVIHNSPEEAYLEE